MKKYDLPRQLCSLLLLFIFISCSGQVKTPLPKDSLSESKSIPSGQIKIYGPLPDPSVPQQVSQYIRRMLQDKNGNIWFGTNGDGVCRYDGKSLTYFTTTEGFSGNAVRGIAEDVNGNIWFATNGGVCRYDGRRASHPCVDNSCKHDVRKEKDLKEHSREVEQSFTHYTMMDGLGSDEVWSILIDRTGNLWFGTEGGVSRFDPSAALTPGGISFFNFPLPVPDLKDFPDAYPAAKLVNSIFQDKTGNIWFGTNGNGVYRYDPEATRQTGVTSLINISEKDGLSNNFVQCISEDKTGNFWFCTRFGGLSRYNPATGRFSNFTTKNGMSTNFFWTILEDTSVPQGGIWFGTAGGGLYHYNPANEAFTNFTAEEGLSNKYIQSILKDKNGNLWIGASGGLFRYDPSAILKLDGKLFINVTSDGPWP